MIVSFPFCFVLVYCFSVIVCCSVFLFSHLVPVVTGLTRTSAYKRTDISSYYSLSKLFQVNKVAVGSLYSELQLVLS